jgi:hypothetical protein
MNKLVCDLLNQIENGLLGADMTDGPIRTKIRELPALVRQLKAAISRASLDEEEMMRKRGTPVQQVDFDELVRDPIGRDILLRAMAADPIRTETDLRRLGAAYAASVLGADHAASVHRGEVPPPGKQLEMYSGASRSVQAG